MVYWLNTLLDLVGINANRRAYQLLSGLISFFGLMESSLYPPGLFVKAACLGQAYSSTACQWPGPLGTLAIQLITLLLCYWHLAVLYYHCLSTH